MGSGVSGRGNGVSKVPGAGRRHGDMFLRLALGRCPVKVRVRMCPKAGQWQSPDPVNLHSPFPPGPAEP